MSASETATSLSGFYTWWRRVADRGGFSSTALSLLDTLDRLGPQRISDLAARERLSQPGVTGLAQVRGFRGEARTSEDIRKRVVCDIEYIEGWSLLQDLAIVLETAWQVLRPPRSAY